jgi:hypothetical protein
MKGLSPRPTFLALLCGGALVLPAGGCASFFGPKALEKSHGPYNEAVRLVDEEQLLRNIVHLRYTESPLVLKVGSIATQYEVSGQAEARPFFGTPNPAGTFFRTFVAVLPDVFVEGANRPTVTLNPADDADAIRQFLTPIPPETLVFLAEMGWGVSSVLRLWLERLNGVPNASPADGAARGVAPDFVRFKRVAELFQAAQDHNLGSVHGEERTVEASGPLPVEAITSAAAVEAAKNGMEYRPRGDGKSWMLLRKERHLVLDVHPGAEASPEISELTTLLNLVPGQRRYDVVVTHGGGPDPLRYPLPPSMEIRAQPRSTIQALVYLANGVEVPTEHEQCGLVRPPVDPEGHPFDAREVTRGLFEVHVSKGHKPPATAYIAVKYRGWWYYIDDGDLASKTTFGLILHLSRLDFGSRRVIGGPILTLPVGR